MEAELAVSTRLRRPPRTDRTDTDLTREVLHRLRNTVAVPLSVHADVLDGFIYLTGTAPTGAARDAAESAIRCLAGVKGIVNDIAIAQR
jgi:osmotically-inducible protein OsmY